MFSRRTGNILCRVTLILKHGEIGIHPIIEITNNCLSSRKSKLMQNRPITNLRYIAALHNNTKVIKYSMHSYNHKRSKYIELILHNISSYHLQT
jgi:hypothetical protein